MDTSLKPKISLQDNKKTNKNKNIDMRSINARILMCFLAVIVVIFIVFWVAVIIFMKTGNFITTEEQSQYIKTDAVIMLMFYITIASIVLAGIVAVVISYILSKPITKLTIAAKRVAEGEKEVDFNVKGYTEINELSKSLAYMNEKMLETDSLRRDLLANVSHDFRTPLTIIKAYAEMIKDVSGDDKEKRDKHCTVIVDEADRLNSLVQDILDLSKIEVAGATIMNMEDVDMSELTLRVADRFYYLTEKGEYQIKTDIEEGLFVRGDEQRLEQVVYNLIANAINYTGDDKVVEVSLKKTPRKKVRFEVKDTGKGMSEEDQIKVWQRYYRSADTNKRQTKGTGLGLAIVKTILEAHKARYGIQSVVGCGSTFYFEL